MRRTFAACLAVALLTVTIEPGRGADDKPQPTNLEKLNTDKNEDDPHLSANGLSLFYTSTSKNKSEILLSIRKTGKAAFAAGKAMPEISGKADYRSVFLAAEGKFPQYLFYATNRDPEKKTRGDNYDIYFLMRQFPGAEFTTETGLRVCTARDEMHPWMTPDGMALYFSRNDKEGWRVYVTRKPPGGGQWGKEEPLDFPVGFHHATIVGKVMYLQGPLENNRWGLFRSTLNGKTWSKPEPLDELNDAEAPIGDKSPCLSRDGSLLYFASDRAGGKGGLDLWVVPTASLEKKK